MCRNINDMFDYININVLGQILPNKTQNIINLVQYINKYSI